MDEKLKKIIFIVLGCFVVLFLFLFMISSCSKSIPVDKLELEIVNKAKYYYDLHKEELPGKDTVITLSLGDLANKGIIKELDKLLDDNTTCSGTLTIENNNNYYMYSPSLNCTTQNKTYKTEKLKDILLENVVTSGNGLYLIGDSYYFRGDVVNNYLEINGTKWRITKINNDNSIRLIEADRRDAVVWDDRYNSSMNTTSGINDFYTNGLNSRILQNLIDIYNSETVISNDVKGYIKETSLCIGKRSLTEAINDGSIECASTLNNQYLGLLQFNEYIIASLDTNCVQTDSNACINYNYLSDFGSSYWTLTANIDNTNQVYKINKSVMSTAASNSGMARIVINISENTNVTGMGTESDPYIVAGFEKSED